MRALAATSDLRRARIYNGSYSFTASDGSTAAKIVIIEENKGTWYGASPNLQDGVYVWVRTNGDLAGNIWGGEFESDHQLVFDQLSPTNTLGVNFPSGNAEETAGSQRFAHFPLQPDRSENLEHPSREQIVRLLAALSQV
ncbi:MAG: hypothetical protein Fues2KO_26960 [Fuerstiella sp.]